MLVAFILSSRNNSTHPGFCHVVNNPLNWAASYCVPVCVVTFGPPNAPPAFVTPLPTGAVAAPPPPRPDAVGAEWVSPFRWRWERDDHSFEPYPDRIHVLLEGMYAAYKHEGGPSRFTTPPLTRYVDDLPQTYIIDFVASTQRNTKTSYVRMIERVPVPCAPARVWEFLGDGGEWQSYEAVVQAAITAAYAGYNSGTACAKASVQFPGRPEMYTLDFVRGVHTNTATGKERFFRRQ